MSENKHTPGPWKQVVYDDWLHIGGDEMEYVQYDPMDEPYNYAVENAVCVVEHVENMTETDYANAALIAAAPDLLEVCEKTAAMLHKRLIHVGISSAEINVLNATEAAIEKAQEIGGES